MTTSCVDIENHPCFNRELRHQVGRVHLPVAPNCNLGCNFCNRKYDCANESRPGVTSTVLTPGQALAYLERILESVEKPISVVGIAGPGDPFANPDETLDTLRRVRAAYPEMLLCVASNGLNLLPYVDALAELKVSHVTITVNAVDPEIGAEIYRFVRPKNVAHRGQGGAAMLWEAQREAIIALKARDIIVKINSIVMPGVNDHHIETIAETVAELGADMHNCMALVPVAETPFEHLIEPTATLMTKVRTAAGRHLPQMSHCTRCRADAVGLLGDSHGELVQTALREAASLPNNPGEERPYVAVASMEGMLVNQHLGEADEFLIFEAVGPDDFRLLETRPAPPAGHGLQRWRDMAAVLHDCRAVLCSAAGHKPRVMLGKDGIRVITTDGVITELLEALYAGHELPKPIVAGCSTCTGSGTGCG